MNDMRKLMESVEQIDEGYFSRLATELDELYRANPNTPDENLIAFVGRKHGEEAADFFRSQIESGEYEQSLGEDTDAEEEEFMYANPFESIDEGMFGEETFDEMVDYWKGSLSRSIVSKGVFTQMYDAAGRDIDVLNREIEEEAYSIAESYHGTGDGIGSSDQNHFVANIARNLGIEDVFGWNKPKLASDEDMERDKANRGAKYGKAVRGEGIEEGEEDKNLGPYEDNSEKWLGQTVKITGGEHRGETGKVVDAKWERNDTGSREGVYQVKLYGGPVVTLYLGEWTHDQIELAYDPTHRPDGKYDPELEEAKPAHWLADKDRPSVPKPDLSDIEYETCAECGVNGGHKDDCPKLGAMYKEGLSEGESEVDEVVKEWMDRFDKL